MKRSIYLFFAIISVVGLLAISGISNVAVGQSGTLNGHKYVDLGLPSGTRWAICNIGASDETEYGDYFAWGETKPKKVYNGDTYELSLKLPASSYVDKDGFTHIIYDQEIDDIARTSFDAATANWGNGWCMPTKEQLEELQKECTWDWVSKNGVYGYKITGFNGNYIFMPAAGYCNGSNLSDVGSYGYYWSSSLRANNEFYAWYLQFYTVSYFRMDDFYRFYGRSVRPVCVSVKN